MKKALIIFIVALIFFGILGAILFKALSPSTSTPPSEATFPTSPQQIGGAKAQQPDEFAKAFYAWYIGNFSTDPFFPHADSRDSILSPWLTPRFIADWQNIITEIDADPVLLAQDNPKEWGSNISAAIVDQDGSSAKVTLSIGMGEAQHTYLLSLVKTSGGWRIDSVSGTQ